MIPRRWAIGPFVVEVRCVPEKDLDNGNTAQFESNLMVVKIDEAAAWQVQAEACLHELYHAELDQRFHDCSQPDNEEIVRFATSSTLDIVLRNKPSFWELIRILEQARPSKAIPVPYRTLSGDIKWEKR